MSRHFLANSQRVASLACICLLVVSCVGTNPASVQIPPGGLTFPDCNEGQVVLSDSDGTLKCGAVVASVSVPSCTAEEVLTSNDGKTLVCVKPECVASGDMAITGDMAGVDMSGADMTAGSDMTAIADMTAGNSDMAPALNNLTVLWSYNKQASTTATRWSTTTGVTATLDGSHLIASLTGGLFSAFAPGTCLAVEPAVFSSGRILQWATGGNATCTPDGQVDGYNATMSGGIGNFNAVVGIPSAPLAGPLDVGFILGGSFFEPSATSPMFDNPSFFNANLTDAIASVLWAGNGTHIGLKIVVKATELSGTVNYTLETTGGYQANPMLSEINSFSANIAQNGSSSRIPVTSDVAGVVCGGTTSCFADVRIMFFDSNTMALVYQMGGANPIASNNDLNALRGAVVLQFAQPE